MAVLALRKGAGDEPELLLERNFRYSVGKRVIELPAGTLDVAGEEPAACARRELIEETGFRAERVRRLFSILPSPGLLTERLVVFAATGLTEGRPEPEAGEWIECFWVPWRKALRMVRKGEIEDAKTICGILYGEAFGLPAVS